LGTINKHDPFPHKLFIEHQLLIKTLIPSPFALHFIHSNKQSYHEFIDEKKEMVQEDIFLSLLSCDADFNGLEINVVLPKFFKPYHQLLSLIIDNNFEIRSRTKKHPFSVNITPEIAKARKKFMDYKKQEYENEEVDHEIIVQGILIMGDVYQQTFTIADNDKIYHGNASQAGVDNLKNIALGSKVQAELLFKAHKDKLSKSSYILLSLKVIF
jgi:hypothetical protein